MYHMGTVVKGSLLSILFGPLKLLAELLSVSNGVYAARPSLSQYCHGQMQEHPLLLLHLLNLYVLSLGGLQLGANLSAAILHIRGGSFIADDEKLRFVVGGNPHREGNRYGIFRCCISWEGCWQLLLTALSAIR